MRSTTVGFDFEMLIALISLIFTFLLLALTHHVNLNNLQRDLYSLKRDLDEKLFYSNTRKITKDLDLLSTNRDTDVEKDQSNLTIILLGINCLGTLNYGYEDIIKKITNGSIIQILLLNPGSNDFFQQRLRSESKNRFGKRSTERRLISEWNASMMIIADIIKKTGDDKKEDKSKKIRIKKFSEPVNYGMTGIIYRNDNKIIKPSRILLNSYSGEGRGYQQKQFICNYDLKSERLSFKRALSFYEEIWEKAEKIIDVNQELMPL